MNCHDAQTMMHGYLDGELDPSVSLQYQKHVGECPACSKALAEHQALQATMKADSLYFKAPGNLRNRLRASLRKQCGHRSVRRNLSRRNIQNWQTVLPAVRFSCRPRSQCSLNLAEDSKCPAARQMGAKISYGPGLSPG